MFNSTVVPSPRAYAQVSSAEGRDRYTPTARSSLARRAAMTRRQNSSTDAGSPDWSATLFADGSAMGSHGVTPGEVKPPPGPPCHGIGVRSGSRPA